jgi:TRAP transporter TAXI family solute receptor
MTRWVVPWLNSLTAAELALVFCGFFVVLTFLGIALVHPLMRRMVHGKGQANDVVIFAAANYGLVYAVLVGLLIVSTFQITKDLQDRIAMEASNLSTMYRSADAYPEPLRSELRSQLRDYTHYVLEKDWPAHRKAQIFVGGDHRLQAIRHNLLSFEPTSKTQEVVHGEMLRYFNTLNVSREQRLSAVTSSIPGVLWYVVIIGAVVAIVFLWMLHMHLMPQLLLGGITAFSLGIMTFLIYAMDHPLQGGVNVGSEPFQSVYDLTMKWDESARSTFVSLGTGELNGVYYPVGRAICEIVDRDMDKNGESCSVEGTPGSVYNVDAIRSAELEFGIVQSDVAYAAYNGEGEFTEKSFRELSSFLVLYPELVTIIARRDSGIHQIADLAGRRINVGRRGSGTHATWDTIRAAFGWTNAQKVQTTELPADAAARALCAGEIDASLLVVGHPSATVRAQLATCATDFVAVNGPVIDALLARTPYLSEGLILGHFYGSTADTPSFGGNAVLMTSTRVDARVVAPLARAIVAHIGDLRTSYLALGNLTVYATTGGNLPAPLHPAASQVYKDLGLSR